MCSGEWERRQPRASTLRVICCDQRLGQSICASGRRTVLSNLAPDTHLPITLKGLFSLGFESCFGCGQGSLQPPGSLAGCCLPAPQQDVLEHGFRLPPWELARGVLEGLFPGTVAAGPTDNVLVVHSVHTLGHLAEGHPKVSRLKAALLFHNTCAFPPHLSLRPQPFLHDFRLFRFPSFLLPLSFFSLSFFSLFLYQLCSPGCVLGFPW